MSALAEILPIEAAVRPVPAAAVPQPGSPQPVAQRHALSEADAVDIWIARWLRIRRKDLLARYGCDPRRLYEIWEESRFPGARAKAIEIFRQRHPGLVDRIDYGRHHRVSRTVHPDQLSLFE